VNCGGADLTIGAKVGIGLGAGAVAGIVIGVVACVMLSAGGAAAYKYRRVSSDSMSGVGSNPLYSDSGRTGRNPLYRLTQAFKR